MSGFAHIDGPAQVIDCRPPMDLLAIPAAEGGLRGRIDELPALGSALTGDNRPPLLTIHGGGGLGKTALAQAAAERFAFAWPGGVWATTLENLPTRAALVGQLARFLDIAAADSLDPADVERQVLERLRTQRTLIVLDNAETLVDAIEAGGEGAGGGEGRGDEARDLADLLRVGLADTRATRLVTSRTALGWAGEQLLSLGGLSEDEGAALFVAHAPQRANEIALPAARSLSRRLDGHPLSLRLLGGAFNGGALTLDALTAAYETHLMAAEDLYRGADHRHRSLFAAIDTSVRLLPAALHALLSGLCIFHAYFRPEEAVTIFNNITLSPPHPSTPSGAAACSNARSAPCATAMSSSTDCSRRRGPTWKGWPRRPSQRNCWPASAQPTPTWAAPSTPTSTTARPWSTSPNKRAQI